MHPFYANFPPPTHPLHHQSQFGSAVQYPPATPHGFVVPHNHSLLTFDQMIKRGYTDGDSRLRDTMSRSWFPNPETRRQCSDLVKYLRIHRNLFMHTYVHLVSCCQSRYVQQLMDDVYLWKRWGSIQQLTHHSLIRDKLLSFVADYPCHQHKFLLAQHLVDDDGDLLYHLLYCGRKPELYELPNKAAVQVHGYALKESEQVVELLWQLLAGPQENDVARRLRAQIYRMARKSAYLPHSLQINHPSISNRHDLGAGANAMVTKATMNGRDVVIKKILCNDHAARRKCLEMFAGEAVLWGTLRHENIVPFLGVITEGTLDLGLISPFFRNGNIKNYMKRYGHKYWPALAKGWAKDLAEGLKYIHCHEPPIVHGDLKGDNVLVSDTGHACLGDFGQSHASDSGKYLDSTRVGLVAHTPVHWMAPEIIEGGERAKASDKSDIYSFGCVLFEMMSGKIPFDGLSFGHVVTRVRNGDHPNRPESISRDDPLWKIARSCWDRPEARPSATYLVSFLP